MTNIFFLCALQDQAQVNPKKRKIKRPTFEEFWNSEEPFPFRISCERYGDFRKLKEWILAEVEKLKQTN